MYAGVFFVQVRHLTKDIHHCLHKLARRLHRVDPIRGEASIQRESVNKSWLVALVLTAVVAIVFLWRPGHPLPVLPNH